jgi:hypothetical protein
MATWLIYALGGGFGHLTRASALARAALRNNVRILTNSPYAGCVQRAMPELAIIALDPAISVTEGRIATVRQIEATAPDCLVVDTFPRGLGGELVDAIASFSGPKVFVQRDLNPQYAAAFDLSAFVRNSYDLVLVPADRLDDGLGPFPQTATTAPWLVRSRHEVFTRERACRLLGLREERSCVMVCASGNPDELDWYGAVVSGLLQCAPACEVRCIAPVCPHACPQAFWKSYWPALDLYAAADVVVGGAGYNTVYECLACQVPLVARPWPRKYDRQNLRARYAAAVVDDPKQAVEAALELLRRKPADERCVRSYYNGVTEAVSLIEQLHPNRGGNINSP